jgi:hypothetical protein
MTWGKARRGFLSLKDDKINQIYSLYELLQITKLPLDWRNECKGIPPCSGRRKVSGLSVVREPPMMVTKLTQTVGLPYVRVNTHWDDFSGKFRLLPFAGWARGASLV